MLAVPSDDFGKLLLRVTVGGLMLLHGIHKLFHGIEGIGRMVGKHDLPELLAYGVYVGEVVAPVLIILGVFTRLAGLTLAFNMVVAVALAHTDQILTLGSNGQWGIELQGFYLLSALAIVVLGPGKYALKRRTGWLA